MQIEKVNLSGQYCEECGAHPSISIRFINSNGYTYLCNDCVMRMVNMTKKLVEGNE